MRATLLLLLAPLLAAHVHSAYPIPSDPAPGGPDWTADGGQAGAGFGWSVAAAGDTNGDGFDDVIVGAYSFDADEPERGRAFVYLGSADGLEPAAVWSADGSSEAHWFGFSVSVAGDVNGDGFDDVIVGAPALADPQANEGAAFVYLGSQTGPANGAIWSVQGEQESGRLGQSVSGAGDVNGDGYDDVIVGMPGFNAPAYSAGRALVYLGSPGGLSSTPHWTAEGDVALADFGRSVSAAGDVNGDGFGDVIVGAPDYDGDQENEGRAYVFLGSASGPSPTADWIFEGDQDGARLGGSVCCAGDLNGDGLDDFAVGASTFDALHYNEGRVFVFLASPAGLPPTADWTADGGRRLVFLGRSVAGAGDANGDGFDDLLVGSRRGAGEPAFDGAVTLFLGSPAGPSPVPDWAVAGSGPGGDLGYSVAGAGDVNADGFADRIAGDPVSDDLHTDEGRAFAYHGRRSQLAVFCACDGSGGAPPCDNPGGAASGCENATFRAGCLLTAAGCPSVSDDTLRLVALRSTPNAVGLFFQGEEAVGGGSGAPFGDGLRCAGGAAVQLEIALADGQGTAISTVEIAAAAGLGAGDVRRYQWVYRDRISSPCGSGFNLSNGLEGAWLP